MAAYQDIGTLWRNLNENPEFLSTANPQPAHMKQYRY
jgi:hypothetical protein